MGFSSKPLGKRTTPSNVFGHIPDVPVGSTFQNRSYLHFSLVHSGHIAGIYGKESTGCYSVVLSGGYEDDVDEGDQFIYTGCGGHVRSDGMNPRDGPQTCDQSFQNTHNAALKRSARAKNAVRIVRGYNSTSNFAPTKGFRYDGLYRVEDAWLANGKSGFKVCKFHFRRLPGQRPIPRRDSGFRADLSEWEPPRHFGEETIPLVSSHTVLLHLKNKTENGLSRRLMQSPLPRATSTRQSTSALPILPTSNAIAFLSMSSPSVQTPVAASVPNMNDLLAEWKTPFSGGR